MYESENTVGFRTALDSWMSRHRHPVSFWLHMIGIPASFVAAPVMLVRGHWLMGVALFVGGAT